MYFSRSSCISYIMYFSRSLCITSFMSCITDDANADSLLGWMDASFLLVYAVAMFARHVCNPFFINCFYASQSSGDAYSDRQLTLNFELWLKFFVCRHVSLGFRIVCVSVCPYPEKRNHPSFVNISPTVVIMPPP